MAARHHDWSRAGVEPRLDGLINDPIVALVMGRDNVTTSELLEVAARARARLHRTPASAAGQEPPAGDVDQEPG